MRIVKCKTQKEILDNILVRGNVFIVGQQIDWEIEFDGLDEVCTLYVAYIDNEAVGAARLYHDKVGRVATIAAHRNKGVATKLMTFIEADARTSGIDTLKLNAQLYIAEFYIRRGYIKQGSSFYEAGIEHIHMTKKL